MRSMYLYEAPFKPLPTLFPWSYRFYNKSKAGCTSALLWDGALSADCFPELARGPPTQTSSLSELVTSQPTPLTPSIHPATPPPPYPTLTPPHTSPPPLLTAGDNSSKGLNADLNVFPPPTPLTPKPPRSPLHHRPGLESMSDRVTLTDYEARRLLNAIVKEFVQMTAEELEQQATEGNRYTDDKQMTLLYSNPFFLKAV